MAEDDPVIAEHVAKALEADGHRVDCESNGEDALAAAAAGIYGLVVLDVMMPGANGLEVAKQLRQTGDTTPILMLTARDAITDRVRGLESGADDYLIKPFDVRELRARVRALLRRESVHRSGVIEVSDLQIDTRRKTVKRAGKDLVLTSREYELLESLARNEGRILTRTMILETVWGDESLLENTVNYHVAELRKKVDGPFADKLIHTVHGLGYRLHTGSSD